MKELPHGLKVATVWLLLGLLLFVGVQWWLAQGRQTQFELHGQHIELHRARDGHYHWPGTVNGTAVDFLVDTGATSSALPASLAATLGLRSEGRVGSLTAGGAVRGDLVRADVELRGGVSVRNLRLVALPALGAPLLGMDVLGRLSWRQADGRLLIELDAGRR